MPAGASRRPLLVRQRAQCRRHLGAVLQLRSRGDPGSDRAAPGQLHDPASADHLRAADEPSRDRRGRPEFGPAGTELRRRNQPGDRRRGLSAFPERGDELRLGTDRDRPGQQPGAHPRDGAGAQPAARQHRHRDAADRAEGRGRGRCGGRSRSGGGVRGLLRGSDARLPQRPRADRRRLHCRRLVAHRRPDGQGLRRLPVPEGTQARTGEVGGRERLRRRGGGRAARAPRGAGRDGVRAGRSRARGGGGRRRRAASRVHPHAQPGAGLLSRTAGQLQEAPLAHGPGQPRTGLLRQAAPRRGDPPLS